MADKANAIKNDLNRRAREVGIFDQELTLADLAAVRSFYGFTCLKCGKERATSIDHVKALSVDGQNTIDNLQLLCTSCNKAKGKKEEDHRKGRILTPELVAEYANSSYVDDEMETEQRTYKKHDWNALQFEYVSTDISLRDLADKFDMDASLVLKRAASERWLKERKEFAINLLSEVQGEAIKQDVSARMMILEASRIALEEWKNNDKASDLAQLAKILELAARVEGLELNKSSVTVKDWRDAPDIANVDDIQRYATAAAGDYFEGDTGSDTDPGA
jgi:hypothetical protein